MIEIKHRYSEQVLLTVHSGTLRNANLSGADLNGANLHGANLSGADLNGANLHGAYLNGANLSGAYLNGANLSGANLSGANLSGAYLNGADLRGAYLNGADLRGAYLNGADLRGARMIISAGTPNQWIAYGWVYQDYLMIRVGCKEKRLVDARKYWANKKHRREVFAAVEYIATCAKARGWKLHKPRK